MTHDARTRAEAAEARIRPYVRETPLEPSPGLSERTGADVYLKLENLQHTGSFKVRGAFNKLLSLDATLRRRGVVAASTGNHGAAMAHAMAVLDVPGIIFVPETASTAKVANIRRLGGEVRFFGPEGGATEVHARAFAAENGLTYVSPYNDPDVISGQATIGIELLRQTPKIDVVFAPIGGGGLIGGIGGAMKAVDPSAIAVAVSPRNSKAMMESMQAGRIVETRHLPTLSDATAGGVEPGAITFDLCRAVVGEFVDVDEGEIRDAMRLFVEQHHMLLEGAAGAAIAGLLASGRRHAGKSVAVVISGANIGADRLKEAL
jgi:threonine dehydratase